MQEGRIELELIDKLTHFNNQLRDVIILTFIQ